MPQALVRHILVVFIMWFQREEKSQRLETQTELKELDKATKALVLFSWPFVLLRHE